MIRGADALFKFKIPCDYSELNTVTITFWQKDNNGPSEDRPLPIIKVLEQCKQSDTPNELYVELNEEETLRFNDDFKAYVQMIVTDINGKTTASKKTDITVYPIYDDSILDDNIVPTPDNVPVTTIEVDDWLSVTSKNPVQNKVITEKFNEVDNRLSSDIIPNLMPNITADDENKILKVVDGKWAVVEHEKTSNDIEVDTTLSISGMAADAKVTGDKINEINSQIADLLYKSISITGFTNNVATAELGSTVDNVTLSWSINKVPTTLTLSPSYDVALSLTNNGNVILPNLGLESTTTWTLTATDERGAKSTKSTALNFYNGVYYGVSEAPTAYSSEFILGLTKTLRSNKLPSIKVNAGEGEYVYYCLPTRYGKCTFTVGVLTGGFEEPVSIYFTNSEGYEEEYYIYRSNYPNLGDVTVKIE